MPENYLMKVNDKEEVSVRLVGIISEEDCEALLNTEEAIRKVSTAENVDLRDPSVPSVINMRFVVIIKDHKIKVGNESAEDLREINKSNLPTLFISAIVAKIGYATGNKVVYCKDKNKYQFIPIDCQLGNTT